ncbi:hypothetical protein CHY08_06100 [Rhizobium leguminosarum bv. viciae]|uniref:hypothetical protein n=1 Tax=Rhizobium leguminosarum TaxID=384 RepID=UPI000B8CBAAE|nr:hypothetical protein [Rhizobium leguminosarum]ASR06722.1 hypothetical protein CHY08_06100 [Rhizobium leguminosarum bv. viciae]
MPMIATKEGININSNHVVQYSTLRNGQTRFLLSTGEEQSVEAYSENLADLFIPLIPANPGFVAVFAERLADGTFLYRRRSVIAWQRGPAGNYPIFSGYCDDSDTDYEVVVDPDGGVYDSDKNMFASLDEWKEQYEAEANELATASNNGGIKAA